MAVITQSIGTGGGHDHATWTLWAADLDDDPTYDPGDDARGESYDDSPFDEDLTLTGGDTIGLNSVTLTAASGHEHDGTAGTGVRLVASTGRQLVFAVPSGFNEAYTVSWLEWDQNDQGENSVTTIGSTFGNVPVLANFICHDQVAGNAFNGFVNAQSRDIRLQNALFYNNTRDSANVYGLRLDADLAAGGCLNVTVYNVHNTRTTTATCTGIEITSDDADGRVKNTISAGTTNDATGTTADFTFAGSSNIDSANNLSSDDTADDGGGSNHVIEEDPADLFEDVTPGSEDLRLKSGSAAFEAGVDLGTSPADIEIDLTGYDRDGGGDTWSIGCYQATVGGGGPVAVGQASESDLALPIAPAKIVAVGQAVETDTALGITPTGPPSTTVNVGIAVENDSPLAIQPAKVVNVGQAEESDTALPAAPAHIVAVGQAAEADTALPVSPATVVAVGIAAEADTALAITPQIEGAVAVGQAVETDTALPIAPAKIVAVGIAGEADTALAITPQIESVVAVGLAVESDTALAVGIAKVVAVGIASETDTALPITAFEDSPGYVTVADEITAHCAAADQRTAWCTAADTGDPTP